MKYDNSLFKSKLKTSKYDIDEQVRELFPYIKSRFPDKVYKNIVKLIINFIRNKTVPIPRDDHWYTELQHPYITKTYMRKALKILNDNGYIIKSRSGYQKVGFETGFVTNYTRTLKFEETFKNAKKRRVEVEEREVESNYKDCKKVKYNKLSKEIRDYYFYNITHFKSLDTNIVKRLNSDYFSQITLSHKKSNNLDIFSNVSLSRLTTIRNGNEICGCRFYQTGGESYLQMPSEYSKFKEGSEINRKDLLINGKETVEADYSCQHISLLYNIGGMKSPYKDNYKAILDELNVTSTELRYVVKDVMLRLLNAMRYGSFKISYNKKPEDRAMVKLLKDNNLDLDAVADAIRKVHPMIARFIGRDAGVYLQRHDSNIMERVLVRMSEENILGVPVHDSIRFIKSRYNTWKGIEIMREVYKEYTGYEIGVSISE